MNDLLVHPKTSSQIEAFASHPSHAVLLVGVTGSGKLSLAELLAQTILGLNDDKLKKYAYFKKISSVERKAIGIDSIRELERFLSLKVPIDQSFNRAVIVEDSQLLTIEAQNALLKLLEEPPAGTIIILTTNHAQSLLPTIRSRTQLISLTKPDEASTKDFFLERNFTETKVKLAFSVSGGLPGLMSAMLNDTDHPLTLAITTARDLLGKDTYERLLTVDQLSKQRELAIDTTFILKQMAHVSLLKATGKAAQKWKSILKVSYEANEKLSGNTSAKLALTKLMLDL